MQKLLKSKKGFTLVEMIVVIVIIAILTAALVFSLVGYVNKAKAANVQVEASNAYTAAQSYLSETIGTSGESAVTADKLKAEVKNLVGADIGDNIKLLTYDAKGTITAFTYTKDGTTCTFASGKWSTDTSTTGTVSGSTLIGG
jgi:prepilin-type N-terminal cleavage/methylation domain